MTTFDARNALTATSAAFAPNTPCSAGDAHDPVYVEAARPWHDEVIKEGGENNMTKAAHAFRLVLTRPPTEAEVKRLVGLFDRAREKYQKDVNAATAMATKPLGPLPKEISAVDAAAWTVVGNVLLNLDETLAKR
jgi:hypothetical protein